MNARTLCSLAALALAGCSWSPQLYRSPAVALRPIARAPERFSFVSLNTWRLKEPSRVGRIVRALGAWERALFSNEGAAALPDVISFQELEGDAALEALRARLSPTHALHVEICARKSDGQTRSAVGLAVRRDRFVVQQTRRIELGSLFPDHPRCALVASLEAPAQRLSIVSVHLSSRPGNGPQAARLVRELTDAQLLDGRALIVAGDFNFHPRAAGYGVLTRVLRDPLRTESRPTHWFGGRIDFAFASDGVELLAPLDASVAYRVARPSDALDYPRQCEVRDPSACPVSDHIPVGGVFRFASR